MLTTQQVHKFNDEYVTRYAHIISEGKRVDEMKRNHWRELAAFETGIKCFHIGGEYTSEDKRHILKIGGMVEEHSFYGELDGEEVVLEIFHDDESEYLVYHPEWGDKTQIQFKP